MKHKNHLQSPRINTDNGLTFVSNMRNEQKIHCISCTICRYKSIMLCPLWSWSKLEFSIRNGLHFFAHEPKEGNKSQNPYGFTWFNSKEPTQSLPESEDDPTDFSTAIAAVVSTVMALLWLGTGVWCVLDDEKKRCVGVLPRWGLEFDLDPRR